ncbi:uncharacterized protein LOC121780072 [Salvia splendens]|uniref:uncharacterized protein LOC121780072 n=1 Tax=Salvia splendens TaxID=180675 RepID=UPI001C2665B5|nr:uncharacterized protein LOC121780072 [Salvia splendens]
MARTEYSSEFKNQVVQFIIGKCVNGVPPRGTLKEAQLKFKICRQTTTRYWNAAKKQQANGEVIQLVSQRKMRKYPKKIVLDIELLKTIHFTKRSNLLSLSNALKCSKTTVWRWVQAGLIRPHTSAIKPNLTADHMLLRLRFTLQSLELDRILNRIMFRNMDNTIHIDEKWFYITQGSQRFYLAPGEAEPHRTCKNKKFISKIMFMCAVSRPLFGQNGEVLFDGKIGIFPFTKQVAAQRTSKNRVAGTMETKPIESITKEVTKQCLINKIIPTIFEKWPEGASKRIRIQQDNAKPHIKDTDPDFKVAAQQHGFSLSLVQQPPCSPDTNVNDLGWFRAIQSLQVQTACKTIDDLIKAVEKSFHDLSPQTLDNVFLSLQSCMVEILKVKGQNSYKVPHLGKNNLRRNAQLPKNLEVSLELVMETIAYLKQKGCFEGLEIITQALGVAFL